MVRFWPRRTSLLIVCLWMSNLVGQAQTLLKDIVPGPTSSNPSNYVTVNGVLYFTADDGKHGRELWKSDGTAVGTVLVKDINPGPKSADIQEMTVCNGLLFFSAYSTANNSNTRQLWRSDGTDAGTYAPDDGHKDGEVQRPVNLTNVKGTLFYVSRGSLGGTDQWHLARSDGKNAVLNQPGGTGLFYSFNFSPATDGYQPPANLTNLNGTLYFTYQGALYKTTGAPDDPKLSVIKVATVPKANRLVNHQNKLYFVAGSRKSEVWTSGGTAATTSKWVSTGLDSIVVLTSVGNYLYFVAGMKQRNLWVGSAKLPPQKLATFPVVIRRITNLKMGLFTLPKKTPPFDLTYFIAGDAVYSISSTNWKLTKLPGTYKNIESLVKAGSSLFWLDAKGLYQVNGAANLIGTRFTTQFFTYGLTALNDRLYFSHLEPNPGLEPCYVTVPAVTVLTSPPQPKAP